MSLSSKRSNAPVPPLMGFPMRMFADTPFIGSQTGEKKQPPPQIPKKMGGQVTIPHPVKKGQPSSSQASPLGTLPKSSSLEQDFHGLLIRASHQWPTCLSVDSMPG
eukprot:EG_transcript_63487